jgi:hypothetical protein
MTLVHRQLVIACIALLCSGAALANDPPKDPPKADAKKDEAGKDVKADAPAEPDLPSKPYPKNAVPKAFAPKAEPKKFDEGIAAKPADKAAEKSAEKSADKPADKVAEKPAAKPAEKHGDKHGDKHDEKVAEKPADKIAVIDKTLLPAHNKPVAKKQKAAAAPKPVTDPSLAAVARDSLRGSALGTAYQVKNGDNLDRVIKKTMPNSPFSMEVMREAFARANPQLMSAAKAVKLKPGSTLNVPSAAVLRQVVLGDPAPQAELKHVKAAELHASAPVVAPTIAPTASDLNPPIAVPRQAPNVAYNGAAPEVSPEEKKKWIRFP